MENFNIGQDLVQRLHALKEHCLHQLDASSEPHDAGILETVAEVLDGLERALQDHYHNDEFSSHDENHGPGKAVSPKSQEPWD